MKNDTKTTSSIENRTSTHPISLPEPAERQHLTSIHRTSLPEPVEGQHPPLQHIQIYFQEKGHPEAEAQCFFNYYESNGWLIGGKSPMKDWKAAARNWILNIKKFDQKAKDKRKKQFYEKRINSQSVAERSRSTSLHPTSPPPSSSNYEEPL